MPAVMSWRRRISIRHQFGERLRMFALVSNKSALRVHSRQRWLRLSLAFLFLSFVTKTAEGQDWFRTAIGMDANKPRVAIADFVSRADSAKSHSTLFTQIVRDDLQFSGILEVPSPSFYPPQAPSIPAELKP